MDLPVVCEYAGSCYLLVFQTVPKWHFIFQKLCTFHWSCNEPTWLAGYLFVSVGTVQTHVSIHVCWIFQPARLDY